MDSEPLPPDPRHKPCMTTTIKATSTTDMLSLVPYLLGYHVDDDVVILLLSRHTVEVAMRMDYWMFDAPAMVNAQLTEMMGRYESAKVFFIAYSQDRDKAEEVLGKLETFVEPGQVVDSVRTDGVRWWSRLCVGDCCPAEGHPCDPSSPAVAAAVVAGSTALASRKDLMTLVEGPSLVDQGCLLADLVGVEERIARRTPRARVQRTKRLLADHLGEEDVDDAVCMELGLLAKGIPARDAAWLEMSRAGAKHHLRLWQQVVRVMPDRHAVPALCLMAAAAWLDGNGALMGCCLARVEGLDADYGMFQLLRRVHHSAAPPELWADIRDAV